MGPPKEDTSRILIANTEAFFSINLVVLFSSSHVLRHDRQFGVFILFITSVYRAHRLDHHDFRSLLTDGTMSNTLRHDEHIALFQMGILMRVFHLEGHGTAEEVEQLVCVWVGMPDEGAGDLGYLDIVCRVDICD
jgi:hypothetical protein